MNWESSILNKLYKTLDFKLNISNINKVKNKSEYIEKINNSIDKYNLRDYKIFVNDNGAIYKVKENSPNTFYFDYATNYDFVLCTNIFEIESKFINYEDFSYSGVIKNTTKGDSLSSQGEIMEYQEVCIDGLEYTNILKTHLLKLSFDKQSNIQEFYNSLSKINNYLRFHTYLIGFSPSHYDVILLSKLINWKNEQERDKILLSRKFHHLKRWADHLEQIFELDLPRIEKAKQSKWKEFLGETYKLTSNQNLVGAVLNEDIPTLIDLLNKGENVNSRELNEFKTLAHLACRNTNLNILKILTKYGCDLEALDYEFMTPIFEAVYSRDIALCEYLIEEMKVNLGHKEIQNRTAFYWAACSADLRMVNYLLSKNVDINVPSSMGRTPLSKACWNGKVEIVERLCKEEGLIVNFPDKNGRYPLHNAVWGEYGGRLGKKVCGDNNRDSPEAAVLLINSGHKLDVEDNEGFTPLMIASSTNGLASLRLLLEKGADPNYLNIYGATAIIESTRYGNCEPLVILLTCGKYINLDIKDKYGINALDYSIAFKRNECLTTLLSYEEEKNMLSEDELLHLLIASIKSKCFNSFKIIIEYLNKKEIFIKMNDSGHKYIIYFKEIVERILNLNNLSMFNLLFSKYPNLMRITFISDSQFLLKSFVVSHQLKILINNTNEVSKFININEIKIDEVKEKDSEKSPVENIKEASTITINNVKEATCEESTQENQIILMEDINMFNENLENIYQIYLNNIKENVIDISQNLIKTFICLNDRERLLSLLELIQTVQNTNNITEDEITIDLEFYSFTEVDKKRKIEKNLFEKIWSKILNEITCNNILSLSLSKADNYYFAKIINFKFTHHLFFQKIAKVNSNLLHIIFKYDRLDNLLHITKIIELHFPNRIHELIEMLDQYDCHNLSPLDILIKNNMFDSVEKYTNILNELRVRHNIQVKSHNHTCYKIFNFEIRNESTVDLPADYKRYIDNSLTEANALIKRNSFSELDNAGIYYQYNSISKYIHDINHQITNLITKIKLKNLKDDFILNNSLNSVSWINNKEQLIECCNHLKKFTYIGVDLEFFGNDSEGIVCVIQMSTVEKCFAIDSLKLREEITLNLKEIFEDENIIKILHGCDNDIAWLVTNFEIYTRNVFDTGRAFLVFQKYILSKSFKVNNLPSLNFLTKFFLNIELDKAYQKSDWRIRPLTRSKILYNKFKYLDMFQYALNDAKSVIYLFFIFLGLFHYVIGYDSSDDVCKEFFDQIIDKFNENKENPSKFLKTFDLQETGFIFLEISLRCNELIKAKLKESSKKLTIAVTFD